MESSIVPHKASRRASLPYRNVMDLAKALCKTCRQRRASYAAGVIMALPGIIQVIQTKVNQDNLKAVLLNLSYITVGYLAYRHYLIIPIE